MSTGCASLVASNGCSCSLTMSRTGRYRSQTQVARVDEHFTVRNHQPTSHGAEHTTVHGSGGRVRAFDGGKRRERRSEKRDVKPVEECDEGAEAENERTSL